MADLTEKELLVREKAQLRERIAQLDIATARMRAHLRAPPEQASAEQEQLRAELGVEPLSEESQASIKAEVDAECKAREEKIQAEHEALMEDIKAECKAREEKVQAEHDARMGDMITRYEGLLGEIQGEHTLMSQLPRHSNIYDKVFPNSRAAMQEAERKQIEAGLAELEGTCKKQMNDIKSDLKEADEDSQTAEGADKGKE